MNEMIRQAARMQRKIEQARAEIQNVEVTGSAANDKARAVVTCEGKIKQLILDPEFMKEDLEMAMDALVSATNAALEAADKKVEEHISKATGGIKPPLGR